MAMQTTVVERRRFNMNEYYALAEAGILAPDERVELLDGHIFQKYTGVRRRFTVAEYYAMAQAGILTSDERVELLAGELINMAAIGSRHAFCVRWLIKALVIALGDLAILDAQNPVRLGVRNEPQPDLTVLRWQDEGYPELPGPEDTLLVIEVADTTVGFDRHHKIPMYAMYGIPEVWLFDVNARQVEVYDEPLAGGYERVRVVGPAGILAPAALPHVTISVSEVMPE